MNYKRVNFIVCLCFMLFACDGSVDLESAQDVAGSSGEQIESAQDETGSSEEQTQDDESSSVEESALPQNETSSSEGESESPPTDASDSNVEIDVVSAIVEEELNYQNILGGAVAVVMNGEIVHAKGYGFTSPAMNVPVTKETVFRWASISKTLTAVAALQVDEATDDFSIEHDVSAHVDYWPSDASAKSNVTVKQLLTHRSGIIHYRSTDNCPDNSNPDFDNTIHGDILFNARLAVNVFSEQQLCFNPGNRFRYSTFAYSLAAAALEKEAGQSYSEWVQENVADPLGMTSLTQGTGSSTGYKGGCSESTKVDEGSKSYVLPGGGWASNISDLARFANGILQGTLLDNTERLWNEPTGNSNTYRLGIVLRPDGESAWHSGSHSDLRTFMDLYHARDDNTGIVVYLNNPYADPERVAKRIANGLGISSWSVPLDNGCQ